MKREHVMVAAITAICATAPMWEGSRSAVDSLITVALAVPAMLCALAPPARILLAIGGAAAAVVAGVALSSATRQLRRTRRMVQSLLDDRFPDSGGRRRIEKRLGRALPFAVARSNETFAFTHGLLHPQIVLSKRLIEELDEDELEA